MADDTEADDKPKKPSGGKVASNPSIWSAVGQETGQSLTPRYVADILRAADSGQIQRLHDELNRIRQKDAAVQSLFQTRERALMACGWNVVPAVTGAKVGSPEHTAAEEQAAFVRAGIKGLTVEIGEFHFGFGRALFHLLDAIYKGFSVCEIDWHVVEGSVVPKTLRPIGGRRFGWNENMRLCLVDAEGNGNQSLPGIPLADHPYKFLVHLPRNNGDEPVREGLGRLVLWYACFRLWSYRDWLLFADLYGKPWREFIYEKDDADPEDVDLAKKLAMVATSTTACAHPSTIECKIQWPTATGGAQSSPSPAILQRCEDDLAIAIIGQKATTGTVSGGLGSKGDVRDLVRKDILSADEQELCETIVRQLFAPMILAKYGTLKYLPGLTFATGDSPDVSALLDAITKGVKLGARIPVTYLHDIAGWPMAEGNEPILVLAAPTMPANDNGEEKDAQKPPKKAAGDDA